jgi:hypothetical protein
MKDSEAECQLVTKRVKKLDSCVMAGSTQEQLYLTGVAIRVVFCKITSDGLPNFEPSLKCGNNYA